MTESRNLWWSMNFKFKLSSNLNHNHWRDSQSLPRWSGRRSYRHTSLWMPRLLSFSLLFVPPPGECSFSMILKIQRPSWEWAETLLDTLPLPLLNIPSLSTTPPRPTDVLAPSTPSSRLTPRQTSSGESGTGPELSTEDRLINLCKNTKFSENIS